MSREIVEAMHALAREKGISEDKLLHALEDALLSAYKKQPGAAKYARVEMDPDTGDYRVIELIVPERLEAHLIVETIDEGTYIDPETASSSSRRTRRSTRPSSRSTATRSRSATSRRTTSGASRRRPPSRSSCSGSARPSAT